MTSTYTTIICITSQHYSEETCLILVDLLKHTKRQDLQKVEWLQVTSVLQVTQLGMAAATTMHH